VPRAVTATRYVTPLREGGSMPGLVEADDDGLYVLKFRGAGQGPKALAAELVAREVGRALGLPVPEIVFVELDPALGHAEPDPEIQELIAASGGRNLGMDFLPGALPFAPSQPPDPALAAAVVWFDALVMNVDRTPRNPNLLHWHGRLWLIDHGAALYVHHGDADPVAARGSRSRRSATTCCCRSPARSRRPTRASRRGWTARCWSASPPSCRRSGATAPSMPSTWPGAWRPRARSRRRQSVRGPEPFQYAIVRVVPRVERGEGFNAGVVLFCRPLRFLGARVELDEGVLAALAPDCDPVEVRSHLQALVRVAEGAPEGGAVAALDPSERFHWLVAPASTMLQPSAVHTGLTRDPAAELDRLFAALVAR